LRNLHAIFHSGYINLHYNQECIKVPFPFLLNTFVIVCVIDDSHSESSEVKSHCHFDFHFLYCGDVEHFFMYLLVINK
jgi:hypothetical protein